MPIPLELQAVVSHPGVLGHEPQVFCWSSTWFTHWDLFFFLAKWRGMVAATVGIRSSLTGSEVSERQSREDRQGFMVVWLKEGLRLNNQSHSFLSALATFVAYHWERMKEKLYFLLKRVKSMCERRGGTHACQDAPSIRSFLPGKPWERFKERVTKDKPRGWRDDSAGTGISHQAWQCEFEPQTHVALGGNSLPTSQTTCVTHMHAHMHARTLAHTHSVLS